MAEENKLNLNDILFLLQITDREKSKAQAEEVKVNTPVAIKKAWLEHANDIARVETKLFRMLSDARNGK